LGLTKERVFDKRLLTTIQSIEDIATGGCIMGRKNSLILVLTFVVLCPFLSLTSASANEIWVTPSTSGFNFPSGNWPVSTSPWATFGFAVPTNMTEYQGAKLVVIGKVSASVIFGFGISIAGNGDPQNEFADSKAGLRATITKGQLQEIDISPYIPPAVLPGDYIGINFQFYPSTAVNVVGLRFQYEGPAGPPGPQGERGETGAAGHSPVLTWSGDRISIDGVVTGPHLTGPQGPSGASVYPVYYGVTQEFSCPADCTWFGPIPFCGNVCPSSSDYYSVRCASPQDTIVEYSLDKGTGFVIDSWIEFNSVSSPGSGSADLEFHIHNGELWEVVMSATIRCLGLRPW
jgi:hypothetical protein